MSDLELTRDQATVLLLQKAVLDRLPDYEIDLDGVHTYTGNPTMTGVGKLPVRFTPGPTLATQRPE